MPVLFGSSRKNRCGKRALPPLALAALILLGSNPVWAQSGERKDTVAQDAVDAVTQPLSDLHLRSRDIPPVLLRAQQAPYDLTDLEGQCQALRVEIMDLEEVLGPDADAPAEREGLVNQGLQLGGRILGGLIPFRGIVREISGANAEEARWEAAIYAGVARRSFLKGYARALDCPTYEEETLRSAEEVLGLDQPEQPFE